MKTPGLSMQQYLLLRTLPARRQALHQRLYRRLRVKKTHHVSPRLRPQKNRETMILTEKRNTIQCRKLTRPHRHFRAHRRWSSKMKKPLTWSRLERANRTEALQGRENKDLHLPALENASLRLSLKTHCFMFCPEKSEYVISASSSLSPELRNFELNRAQSWIFTDVTIKSKINVLCTPDL